MARSWGVRLEEPLRERLYEISSKTRISTRQIMEIWINGTTVDEKTKEFITSCGSLDLKKK